MWRQMLVVVTSLLYLEFIVSGLSYVLLALLDVHFLRNIFSVLPVCDWATSVYVLCLAHVCHAATIFGWLFAVRYTLIGLGVVFVMEETGLRTGFIFGEYYFTSSLGDFLTKNQPILVPFLWFALSYPIFVYTYLLVRRKTYHSVRKCVLLASALLTGYDLISEPIGVLYGNQLWHHAAHVDSITPLDTFVPQPDWAFGIQPGASENHASGWKKAYLNILSIPCHCNIPLHNFLGWFVTSLVMYYCLFSCCPPLHTLYTQQPANKDKKSPVPYTLTVTLTLMHRMYLWLPVGAGLCCTQAFYLLHPCHPLLVRGGSCLYLLAIAGISYYFS